MSINPTSFGQMTPASQWELAKLNGRRGGLRSARRRRRKAKAAAPRRRRRRKTAGRARGGRLVKGSAAAKAYMARIRRKRRK